MLGVPEAAQLPQSVPPRQWGVLQRHCGRRSEVPGKGVLVRSGGGG